MQRKIDLDLIPKAILVKKRLSSISLIWLVPAIALILGLWLTGQALLKAGPKVTLSFDSADGLEAGKTKIRYKNVDIGEVTQIGLSKDRKQVIVTADFVKDASDFLVEDTQFWVVRPRIAGGEVSGIGTLFSGSYIALKAGVSTKRAKSFQGLESPPAQISAEAGRYFTLDARDLGSLEVGSPVFTRHIRVGNVVSYEVDPKAAGVKIQVFIRAPYDLLITRNTRFWNSSGVSATVDGQGFRVDAEALVAILTGGIAFESPAEDQSSEAADEGHHFELFADRTVAMHKPTGKAQIYEMQFQESLRGLTAGSPVEFQGIPIGEVLAVDIRFDNASNSFRFPVTLAIYEEELGLPDEDQETEEALQTKRRQVVDSLVAKGLRGQLRTGSLVTGQLFIALEFIKDAPLQKADWTASPTRLPTTPGTVHALEQNLNSILKKVEKMPLTEIGEETRQTLSALNASTHNLNIFIKGLNQNLAPATQESLEEVKKLLVEVRATLAPNSPLQRDLRKTLRETTRSVQSIRTLADTLEGEPESLLKGKKEPDEIE